MGKGKSFIEFNENTFILLELVVGPGSQYPGITRFIKFYYYLKPGLFQLKRYRLIEPYIAS